MDSRARATDVVLVTERASVTVATIEPAAPADFALINWLLQMQLRARRRGWALRLVHARPDIVDLLHLIGVDIDIDP